MGTPQARMNLFSPTGSVLFCRGEGAASGAKQEGETGRDGAKGSELLIPVCLPVL